MDTKNSPVNVGPQQLAPDLLPDHSCFPLDGRTVLSGNLCLDPSLNGLVSSPGDFEETRCAYRAPEGGYCSTRSVSGGFFGVDSDGVHGGHDTQEKLASLENLVSPLAPSHEKLAGMGTIHTAIKERRLSLGMSLQDLAQKVSEIEGLAKPLTWQTVQQWESGKSAPKRARMNATAQALQLNVSALADGRVEPAESPPRLGATVNIYTLDASQCRRWWSGRAPVARERTVVSTPTLIKKDVGHDHLLRRACTPRLHPQGRDRRHGLRQPGHEAVRQLEA